MKQCSELFAKVFDSGTGGCTRTCACGVVHFDHSDNGWDWSEGELERYQEHEKREPEKCVGRDGSIGTMIIGGVEIVHGCACDLAARHERFITAHAELIAEFLNRRADEMEQHAKKTRVPNHDSTTP